MKVIYSYFNNDVRRLIVDYLYDEYRWNPVFFHGTERMRKWAKERYANAIFHDLTSMRQSVFDYSRLGRPAPLDAEIIGALSKYELNYLSWLEDTTGWNFSFFERRRYYYDVLKYWNTVINNLKPDLFVADTLPHLASDYPLYLLCKHYYGIPVLFLNPMPFLDDNYFTIGNSLEDFSSKFNENYLSEASLEVSDVVKKYLERLRSQSPQIPKYIARYWKKLDELHRIRYLDYLRIFKMIFQGTAFKKSGLSFKKNNKPWESDGSKLTNFEYTLFKKSLARKNRRVKKIYNKIAESPAINKKYVYFPAPYQPEVFSNLFAGIYEDVFLVLDMISQIIPDDWLIYYKEHPNTFKEEDKGSLMRDEYFYRKIISYKNVRIIPFQFDNYKLIDNSQAVCSIGGTPGWEAAVRGKPALVYGSTWYQGCKSIFMIKTFEDAIKAMKEIMDGFVPGENDINRYAEAIYRGTEYGLVVSNELIMKVAEGDDPKFEMERVAKAFHGAYEFYYGRRINDNLYKQKIN